MAYFLRYTDNANKDLKRGYSYHYSDDGKKHKLLGLCAFELDSDNLEDAIKEAKEHYYNQVYNFETMGDLACIFEGVLRCTNEEGVLILPTKVLATNI